MAKKKPKPPKKPIGGFFTCNNCGHKHVPVVTGVCPKCGSYVTG